MNDGQIFRNRKRLKESLSAVAAAVLSAAAKSVAASSVDPCHGVKTGTPAPKIVLFESKTV